LTTRKAAGLARFAAVAAAGALLLTAESASAVLPWGGSVQWTSASVFRGVSQSNGEAALQADLHWRGRSGWFAGVWVSSLSHRQASFGSEELNLFVGHSWVLDEHWGASLRGLRYAYPNSPLGQRYDSNEFSASFDLDDRLVLSVAGSPDTSRYTRRGWALHRRTLTYEASLRQPLGAWPVALLASVGEYDTRDLLGDSYRAWSAGLSLPLGPLEVSLVRFAANDSARRLFPEGSAKPRWALSAAWRF
jgi:uncharacterized protein (TIGR02001 family)